MPVKPLASCRVYQQKQYEPLSLGHIARCLVGTGMQALNCWLAAKVLIRAFKSWSPGVMYLAKRFPALQVRPLHSCLLTKELDHGMLVADERDRPWHSCC